MALPEVTRICFQTNIFYWLSSFYSCHLYGFHPLLGPPPWIPLQSRLRLLGSAMWFAAANAMWAAARSGPGLEGLVGLGWLLCLIKKRTCPGHPMGPRKMSDSWNRDTHQPTVYSCVALRLHSCYTAWLWYWVTDTGCPHIKAVFTKPRKVIFPMTYCW